jgi:copper chaperone CopZ
VAAKTFQIPAMTSRRCVRAISARISDVPGVRTVEARLDTQTYRVTGTADPTAVQTAIRNAGYHVVARPDGPAPDGADPDRPKSTVRDRSTAAGPE